MRCIAIFLLLLSLPLRANLGETVTQCVARYGRPNGYAEANTKLPFGSIVFSATGYDLIVFVVDNVEVGARVSKSDKTAFTDAEMKNIMQADSGGATWTPMPSTDPTCLEWTRPDKATVTYDKPKHMLIFTTQKMADMVGGKP